KDEGIPMDNRENDILTIDEAAELLRIPRSSVYKLAQQKKIPAQKVGRHWRFHRATLLMWVAGQANFDGKKSDPGGLDFS
ncbi:MAG: helix-turn-helix domain-containing protein, partial [Chloroflexota bacterium]